MPHEWFWGFTAVSSDQWRWCGCDPWLGTPPLTITKLLWGSNGISNVPGRAFKTLKDVQTYGIIKLGSNLMQGIEVSHDVITSFTNQLQVKHEPRAQCWVFCTTRPCEGTDAHPHVHGTQAVYEERHKRIQHFQDMLAWRLDLGSLETQMQQLKDLKRHFTAVAGKPRWVR